MSVFVDTSAFYAVLDRDDANHQKAAIAWASIVGQNRALVTSNYVVLETMALLQGRIGMAAVRGFQNNVAPIIRVEFVTPEIHSLGVAALLAAAKRKLSLVDCVSFAVMRQLGLEAAFAFDPHFQAHGFEMLH